MSFAGGEVWESVTTACRTRGPRSAAIAYVGAMAPELLPLKAGDQLVVNASNAALLSHATSPDALERFLRRGVNVYSTPRLHAKVVVTATRAVIGSANASANSRSLDEAVLVTSDAGVRSEVRRFINGLPDLTAVDEQFIAAARLVWAKGKGGGRPGVDGAVPSRPFLPEPPLRMHVAHTDYFDWTDEDEEVFAKERRRVRRAAGPAAAYAINSYTIGSGATPYRVGDVLVQIYDDAGKRLVAPPAIVLTTALAVPRRRHKLQLIRERVDLEALPVVTVEAAWRRSRRSTRFDRERWLRDPREQAILLRLWGLAGN